MIEEEKKAQGASGEAHDGSDSSQAGVNPPPAKGELEGVEAKCAEYLAGWKRALADYENVKKDIYKATQEEKARVVRKLTDSMLTILGNFDLAVRHRPDLTGVPDDVVKKIDQWQQGILYIQKALKESLSEFDVVGFEPKVGDPFDEHQHEAIGTRKDEKFPSGSIVEVVNLGWKIGESVVRPSTVIVNE